jgi:selenium-binding protein 1
MRSFTVRSAACRLAAATSIMLALLAGPAGADEPCQSPFMKKLAGQEDYIYVWTLGIPERDIKSDSLVTVGARPGTPEYGKVVSRLELGEITEAHHGGFTDDRRTLWLGGLDTSHIFLVDVATDPAKPRLKRTLKKVPELTQGLVGPHTFYALPGRMLVAFLSNSKDNGGKTGMALFTNDGDYIKTWWMPDDAPYGYDARVNAHLGRLLTSSFTGRDNYMTSLKDVMASPERMKKFGDTVVLWDFFTMTPLQTFRVGGAPLEIRWALQPRHFYAFTTTALDHHIVLIHRKDDGTFAAEKVADIGNVLPVDISLSADDKTLYVTGFLSGTVMQYDVSDPFHPKKVHEIKLGKQVNMVSQSWDGQRVYFTNSLLSAWDDPEEYWMKKAVMGADGKIKLDPSFEVDFKELGRPHIMHFGAKTL